MTSWNGLIVGNFDFELLNWRSNKEHHKTTLSIDARHWVTVVLQQRDDLAQADGG